MKQDSIVVKSSPSFAFMDSGFYEFTIECKLYRPTNPLFFFNNIKGWTIFHFFKINIIVYFQYVGGFNEK